MRRAGAVLLCLIGLGLLVQGGAIQAKAWLAQGLLERAWAQTRIDGEIHRPWPWADHWPVARLVLPRTGQAFVVLSGDSGNVLAFAPGLSRASGAPDGRRTVLISGHRDTHFHRLDALRPGDTVWLETAAGRQGYRVEGQTVVDTRRQRVAVRDDARLLLATCWPLDATVPGGPLRYLVTARRDEG